jgi:hypothetical protein
VSPGEQQWNCKSPATAGASFFALLSSSWRTLYELTRLADEVLEARIADLPFAEDTAQQLMAMAQD